GQTAAAIHVHLLRVGALFCGSRAALLTSRRSPMTTARRPIVVVGSINMDLVVRTPRIALAGETLIGSGFETTPGGKGANQAVAVARLGYPIAMVGMVGEDVFGQALLNHLANAGVDVSAV